MQQCVRGASFPGRICLSGSTTRVSANRGGVFTSAFEHTERIKNMAIAADANVALLESVFIHVGAFLQFITQDFHFGGEAVHHPPPEGGRISQSTIHGRFWTVCVW